MQSIISQLTATASMASAAAQKTKGLAVCLATVVFLLSCNLGGAWSVSTIMSTAADIVDGSLESRRSDPLLDSTDRLHNQHTKVGRFRFNGNGDRNEQFLVPMLSTSVGDNNQFLEYMTAVVIARSTKQTLCLTPFFSGPIKHSGGSGNLSIEDRYDVDQLRKFVKLSSLERCFEKCHRTIHGFWWLRHSATSSLSRGWTWTSNVTTHEFGRDFTNWASIKQIQQTFEKLNMGNDMCVALGGLFPGLRWRGAYLATSLFMRPSQSTMNLATALQNLAIGKDQKFLAVHWRFEESICNENQMGMCFLRCGDGSVISSGLHATAQGFPNAVRKQPEEGGNLCKHIRDSTRVITTKEDLVSAIFDKAVKENMSCVYMATDGWMRGSHGQNLVREVVEKVRSKGLSVSGLWKINDLPNVITKEGELIYNDKVTRELSDTPLTGHSISMVEQEVCFRASSFMGSGESTWSLAVFRARLASRRWKQLAQTARNRIERVADMTAADGHDDGHGQQDNDMIEQLLQDSHAAGLQCRYRSLYRKSTQKVREERYEDEAPDTWLDMEACEGRLARGGSCQLFDCFS